MRSQPPPLLPRTPAGARLRVAVMTAVVAVGAAAGCAKAPTDVLTLISTDATVPPLLILRVSVAGPAGQSTGSLRSTAIGDAADRPRPFAFPLLLPVSADPALGRMVTITIDGLDWDTQAVIATGSTPADLVAEHETQAALTLTAVSGAGGGGADGGASDDALHD